eukprot:1530813-Pyramimonas_sp.AAC.1
MGAGYKANNNDNHNSHNGTVLANVKRPGANMATRTFRLKYLPKRLQHAPIILLRMVDANLDSDSSWGRMMYDNIQCMWTCVDDDHELHPTVDLDPVLSAHTTMDNDTITSYLTLTTNWPQDPSPTTPATTRRS